MKSSILAVSILLVICTSCKKEYTCNCSKGIGGTVYSKGTVKEASKKKADSRCGSMSEEGEGCYAK